MRCIEAVDVVLAPVGPGAEVWPLALGEVGAANLSLASVALNAECGAVAGLQAYLCNFQNAHSGRAQVRSG